MSEEVFVEVNGHGEEAPEPAQAPDTTDAVMDTEPVNSDEKPADSNDVSPKVSVSDDHRRVSSSGASPPVVAPKPKRPSCKNSCCILHAYLKLQLPKNYMVRNSRFKNACLFPQ